jgi:hypothetical protein
MQFLTQYIFAAASWLLIAIFIWSFWKVVIEGITHLKKLHAIPCSRCAYFTGDYRLKCTLHPCDALTEEAINCRDFSHRQHTYDPITTKLVKLPKSV